MFIYCFDLILLLIVNQFALIEQPVAHTHARRGISVAAVRERQQITVMRERVLSRNARTLSHTPTPIHLYMHVWEVQAKNEQLVENKNHRSV